MRPYASVGLLPSDVEIALERTACFGSCPAYRVTVKATGEVQYEGLRYVKMTGRHNGKIDEKEALNLVRELLLLRFFDADDKYAGRDNMMLYNDRLIIGRTVISDAHATILSLKLGKDKKSVQIYDSDPLRLLEIAKKLDDVVEIEQWIGTYCERPRSRIGPAIQPGECGQPAP